MIPMYARPLFDSWNHFGNTGVREFVVCDGGNLRNAFSVGIPEGAQVLSQRIRESYPNGAIRPQFVIRVKPHVSFSRTGTAEEIGATWREPEKAKAIVEEPQPINRHIPLSAHGRALRSIR